MEVLNPRVSYSDLQQAPEDGRRYELYDGEVFVVPSPLPIHQVIAENIKDLLRTYAKEDGGRGLISPIDIVFSEYNVLQPDVVFFVEARRQLVDLHAPIRHAPDLVVEVLSPSTRGTDRGRKMQMYARFGVPEYWIADPETCCLEVHALKGEGYRLIQTACGEDEVRSPNLPRLIFPAAQIFVV